MPAAEEQPIQRLSCAQAAELLGVHPKAVVRMIRRGELAAPPNWIRAGLLRSDVERRSLARWRPGSRTWLTTSQVGEQLGLTRLRIYQLSDADLLPYERSSDGRRLYRPGQVAVMAQTRAAHLQSMGNRPTR